VVEPPEPAQITEQLAARELLGHREAVRKHTHQRLGVKRFLPDIRPEDERAAGVRPQQPDAVDSVVVLPSPMGPTSP